MSIRAKLVVSFVAVILVVTLTMGVYQTRLMDQFFSLVAAREMTAQAARIESLIRSLDLPPGEGKVSRQVVNWAASITGCRVLVVDGSGLILVDSVEGNRTLVGNSVNPEIIARLRKKGSLESFPFPLDGPDAVSVAIPWLTGGRIAGAMILVRSLRLLDRQANREALAFVVRAAILASAIAVVLSCFLSSAVTGPLRKMVGAARSISKGDFSHRVPADSDDELGELGRAMNTMSEEISRLVANLTSEKDKLQKVMDERQKMLSDISHDLRTPVTSIKGFVEALQDGVVKSEEERRRALGIIHDEAERLSRLVNDLFYLTRLESGDLPFDMSEIDLVKIVEDSLARMEVIARKKGISFSLTRVPGTVESARILGSCDRLTQAILNILDNAVRYSPPGGSVRVSLESTDAPTVVPSSEGLASGPDKAPPARRWVVLSIADQGPGIPEEDLPHIFERFYRADKSRSGAKGGAGLGLAIAKFIVEKHGGTLRAESCLGKGATFFMALPLV